MIDKSPLFESRGTHFPTKSMGVFGRIELTLDSIIFYRISPLFSMFGLIGVLSSFASKGTSTLTLPLADIKSFDRQRQGVTNKVLNFELIDGTSHRFKIEKFTPFLTELTKHLSNTRDLLDLGQDCWAVGEKKSDR